MMLLKSAKAKVALSEALRHASTDFALSASARRGAGKCIQCHAPGTSHTWMMIFWSCIATFAFGTLYMRAADVIDMGGLHGHSGFASRLRRPSRFMLERAMTDLVFSRWLQNRLRHVVAKCRNFFRGKLTRDTTSAGRTKVPRLGHAGVIQH